MRSDKEATELNGAHLVSQVIMVSSVFLAMSDTTKLR